MKRKLSAFLVVLCIIFGLSAFTACSNSKDNVIAKNEFTVTFNSNGGSEISPFTGAVLETLPTPTKEGFAFDGWYSTDDLSGTAQTAPLNLVAYISLYAKWKATHEHAYGEWVVTMPATCTTEGTRIKTCTVCGEKLTETIPARDGTHNYGEWIETETGLTKECAVCHHKEVATYTTGLQFEDVDVNGTMVHMASGIGSAKGAIFIPKTHDGKPVEGIKNSAFEGCSSLTSITIPAGVTNIGWRAFEGCSSLTSITIRASVTNIGNYAFTGCGSLTIHAEAASKPADWSSSWNTDDCPVVWDSANNIIASDGYIYAVLEGIRYALKDGNATVVEQPSTITTENIPETVTYKNLTYKVTSIGRDAFRGCSSLTSITITASVTSIGSHTFSGCSRLTSITFEAGSKLTSIGSDAFMDCRSLTSVTIPASVRSIGYEAFRYCSSLTSITIPLGVTIIGYGAFSDCSSLTSVTIPASVTSIGNDAFLLCSSLTSITIPASVTSIGGYAFYDCSSLTSITIPEGVTSIGNDAFFGCSSLTIYAKAASKPADWHGRWNSSYCPVVWDSANNIIAADGHIYAMLEGIRYALQYGNATVVEQPSTITTANIPKTVTFNNLTYKVTSIGEHAFNGCSSLTSVTIPASVTSIGSEAFTGCISLTIYAEAASKPNGWNSSWNHSNCPVVWDSMNNIIASDGNIYAVLEGIRYALKDGNATVVRRSSTITTANIPETVTFNNLTYSVTSIGDYAFDGCSSLTSITIPAGVTSIGSSVFSGCSSLTSITIPAGVTSIGDGAFWGCSSLTIYAEAASKPAGWSSSWNYINRPVYWFSATAPTGAPATGTGYWRYVNGVPTKW